MASNLVTVSRGLPAALLFNPELRDPEIVFDPLFETDRLELTGSKMAKPLEEYSDEELKRGLADGQFGDKKAVIAQEILRRRQEAKTQELKRKYTWLGSILAALSVALVALRRFWRK
jgi:hypothetical protein